MDEYLDFAKGLAQQAGEVMLQHFQIGVARELKPEEGNTPVTIADTAINSLVIKAVQEKYPDHAIIGEEESFDVPGAKYAWVCDPIDGTLPYTLGVPTNVFSLALVDTSDGQPVVAVVYDPYMKRKYTAIKGGGSFMNDVPIHVNDTAELSQAILGNSTIRSDDIDDPIGMKGSLNSKVFRSLIYCSTIYETMLVASGQIAAMVFVGATAHDVVTAKLIVEEAGGKVTDIFGKDQRYDRPVTGALISNGHLHDDLLKEINQFQTTK